MVSAPIQMHRSPQTTKYRFTTSKASDRELDKVIDTQNEEEANYSSSRSSKRSKRVKRLNVSISKVVKSPSMQVLWLIV